MLDLKKIYDIFKKLMSRFINKTIDPTIDQVIESNICQCYSKEAITLIEKFKKGLNDTSGSISSINLDEIYTRFVTYLKEHNKEGSLPRTTDIEIDLGITKKKRLEFYTKAIDEGILIKDKQHGNRIIYKYNINY